MSSDKPIEKELNHNSYEYDVAFSFLSQDEALATEINDLLQDRLKTFLYSKRQGEIAGTDGEETFNRVFGEESRIVVVLYRSGWGETSWTRIERTAIQNRSLKHGYDFGIFIPLDEPPIVPKWLPKTRLWVDLKRWGPTGAASVIEARVREQGGEPHEETVKERAARLARSFKFDERRDQFRNSFDGVRVANQEFEFLYNELQRLVTEIKNSVRLDIKRNENQIVISGFGDLGLNLYWRCHCRNSLDDALLFLDFWGADQPIHGTMYYEKRKLKSLEFQFDLTPSETYVWDQAVSGRQHKSAELASFILKFIMDEGQKRSTQK